MSESANVSLNVNAPQETVVYKNQRILKTVFILAAFSFLTTLNLPYSGEEAVYTISSLEMWFHHEWISPLFYGTPYGRPPFFNWLIIPLASILGWDQMLLASRLVTATSTLLTAFLLIWMMQHFFKTKPLTWLAAAIFLSGDLLLRRGWLAYADPLFSLFIFSAIVFALVAVEKEKAELFLFSALSICAAFLTKAMTAYLFYSLSIVVLFWKHPHRQILLSPTSILCHIFAFAFPFVWDFFLSHGAHAPNMLNDILAKLSLNEFLSYMTKLVLFPLDVGLRLLPASAAVCLFLWRARHKKINLFLINSSNLQHPNLTIFKILFWIAVLNFLPYWLAPHAHVRYLLPLYPIFAAVLAYTLYQLGQRALQVTMVFLVGGIIIKYALGLGGYEYIEKTVRGNYRVTAEDILQRSQGFPLCAADDTATGLSVIAHIDVLRLPEAPLKYCQQETQNLFLLAEKPDLQRNARVVHVYTLGRNKLYLLCRGAACSSSASASPRLP